MADQGTNPDEDDLAEGRRYPSTVERFPDPDSGPWQATFDWRVIDGRIECSGVLLTSVGDDLAVTSAAWRGLRYGERVRRIRAGLYERHGGMRHSTRARLVKAAEVYREAFNAGRPPTKAVAEHFGLTLGGASSLVTRARDHGLLPPTTPGAPQA